VCLYRNAVQVAVTDPAAQASVPAPGAVGCDGDLSALVLLRVVHVEFEGFAFVRFDQSEQILRLVEHGVCSYNVVCV